MTTTNEPWIELKRTDFLSILKALKPSLRVRSAPDRDLQISFENNHLVMSVQGGIAKKTAKGQWRGIASTKLSYFLTFLVATPDETTVRISFADDKVKVSSARFKASWVDLPDTQNNTEQNKHAALPVNELILKFKCPKCRRKQGVAVEALTTGLSIPDEIKTLFEAADAEGHGFGCLSCGETWEEQDAS